MQELEKLEEAFIVFRLLLVLFVCNLIHELVDEVVNPLAVGPDRIYFAQELSPVEIGVGIIAKIRNFRKSTVEFGHRTADGAEEQKELRKHLRTCFFFLQGKEME